MSEHMFESMSPEVRESMLIQYIRNHLGYDTMRIDIFGYSEVIFSYKHRAITASVWDGVKLVHRPLLNQVNIKLRDGLNLRRENSYYRLRIGTLVNNNRIHILNVLKRGICI